MGRSRVESSIGRVSYSASNGYSDSWLSAPVVTEEEYISSPKGRGDKPCFHSKYARNYSYSVTTKANATVTHTRTNYGYIWPCLQSLPSIPFPGDLDTLRSDAYQAMRPKMTTDISLTNFLLELGDIKQLFHFWDRTKSVINNMAAGHLNYSFGWRPFIGDLKAMIEQVALFEERLEDFTQRAGVPQKRHFQASLPSSTITSPEWTDPVSGAKVYTKTSYQEAIFHSTMGFRYSLPSYSFQDLKTRAWLDTLGLNLTPAQLWEALPFSFLIDWVADIGGFLDGLSSSWINPDITIISCVNSVKYKFIFETYIKPEPSVAGNVFQIGASVNGSVYNRWLDSPRILPGVEFRLPNLGQTFLGGSLLATRYL